MIQSLKDQGNSVFSSFGCAATRVVDAKLFGFTKAIPGENRFFHLIKEVSLNALSLVALTFSFLGLAIGVATLFVGTAIAFSLIAPSLALFLAVDKAKEVARLEIFDKMGEQIKGVKETERKVRELVLYDQRITKTDQNLFKPHRFGRVYFINCTFEETGFAESLGATKFRENNALLLDLANK